MRKIVANLNGQRSTPCSQGDDVRRRLSRGSSWGEALRSAEVRRPDRRADRALQRARPQSCALPAVPSACARCGRRPAAGREAGPTPTSVERLIARVTAWEPDGKDHQELLDRGTMLILLTPAMQEQPSSFMVSALERCQRSALAGPCAALDAQALWQPPGTVMLARPGPEAAAGSTRCWP